MKTIKRMVVTLAWMISGAAAYLYLLNRILIQARDKRFKSFMIRAGGLISVGISAAVGWRAGLSKWNAIPAAGLIITAAGEIRRLALRARHAGEPRLLVRAPTRADRVGDDGDPAAAVDQSQHGLQHAHMRFATDDDERASLGQARHERRRARGVEGHLVDDGLRRRSERVDRAAELGRVLLGLQRRHVEQRGRARQTAGVQQDLVGALDGGRQPGLKVDREKQRRFRLEHGRFSLSLAS